MRASRIISVAIITLALLMSAHLLSAQTQAPEAEEEKIKLATGKDVPEKQPLPNDITNQIKEYNSEKYVKPPNKFRQGHVTLRNLDDKAITKNANGFTVQLPSKAPIATPSVHQGIVFVSGGFRSKEYYAFDAQTGQLKWAKNLDDDGPSSAVISDGVVVFNTESCTIFALDAQTGRHLWSWWLGDPLMSTPTISKGRLGLRRKQMC